MRKLLLALLFIAAATTARADGLNGPTIIKLAPGLGNSSSTANTSTQSVKNNQEIYPQLFYLAVTSSCTINSTCASSATSTAGYLLTATAASITFTMPNPGSVGQAPQSFGYDGSHSYTLTTSGGSASIYGCGSSGTSVTLGYSSTLITDGTNYQCIPSPTPVTSANPSATAGASAVNGTAKTFMTSDSAPALPVGSSSQEGILECGSGTTCSGGTISVSGGSAKFQFMFQPYNYDLPTTATTQYFGIVNGANPGAEANDQQPSALACTAKSIYVMTGGTAPGSGNSWAFTFRDNGSGTNMPTVTESNTATTASATGFTGSVSAGDLISMQVVSTGTPASNAVPRVSVECD